MDYAIVSGGDLSQLVTRFGEVSHGVLMISICQGTAAVTELHKLFDWAEKSSGGAVLFFDEADSFLRRGRDDSGVRQGHGGHGTFKVRPHTFGHRSCPSKAVMYYQPSSSEPVPNHASS